MTITSIGPANAYVKIKNKILSGTFDIGEKLISQQIADELGLSRTPVREALVRLETEGLVTRVSNQGYSLRRFSLRDVRDLFEARRVIEISNAKLATHRANEEDLKRIEQAFEKSVLYLKNGDLSDFQKAARLFHRAIAVTANNIQLLRMFDQISDLVLLFGLTLLNSSPVRAREIMSENQAILHAIASGDAEMVSEAMNRHIAAGHQHFMSLLPELNVEFDPKITLPTGAVS